MDTPPTRLVPPTTLARAVDPQHPVRTPRAAWRLVRVAGLAAAVGVLGAYLGGVYLLRYADNDAERAQVRRLVRLQTFTAALFCLATLATVASGFTGLAMIVVLLGGLGVVNYQYLVTQPGVMAPMLARDAARHGRSGPTWVYRGMFGRGAVAATTVFVVAAVLYAFLR